MNYIMKRILIALLIGIIAGIIDVIPMILQDLSWYANISAFVHWIVLGLIIPFIDWKFPKWLIGLVIAELSALPIVIITLEAGPDSIAPILGFSAVLGVLVGWAGKKFV
jgi:hypothetical protein